MQPQISKVVFAQMAESVDALVSNTSGAIHPGSIPGLAADPIYNSKMVTRLVNSVMLDGKKGVAQKIVYEAFSMIQEKTGNDPLETFEKAMENTRISQAVVRQRNGRKSRKR